MLKIKISVPTQEDEETDEKKRGPIVKIDTSDITMSSSRHYTETNEKQTRIDLNFSQVFDQKMGDRLHVDYFHNPRFGTDYFVQIPRPEHFCNCHGIPPVAGQEVVRLSDQFINELEKMRQMMDGIFQQLNMMGNGNFNSVFHFQVSRFRRVNINPFHLGFAPIRTFEYEYRETHTFRHYENENTQFNADGIVKTADGKEIDFSFQLDLEREYFKEDQVMYAEKGGFALIDPLVINLDDTAPKLSSVAFDFDLDLDGETEEVKTLMPGSGFLALDKNEDGIINDGSELFGPSTGDGFAELATYDLDHNLWIDENDEIFDDLSIWENDEQGEYHLTRIKDAGIGAIYLANMETPFDLRGVDNLLEGRITNSGIALTEEGEVKSIQEIDWAV